MMMRYNSFSPLNMRDRISVSDVSTLFIADCVVIAILRTSYAAGFLLRIVNLTVRRTPNQKVTQIKNACKRDICKRFLKSLPGPEPGRKILIHHLFFLSAVNPYGPGVGGRGGLDFDKYRPRVIMQFFVGPGHIE